MFACDAQVWKRKKLAFPRRSRTVAGERPRQAVGAKRCGRAIRSEAQGEMGWISPGDAEGAGQATIFEASKSRRDAFGSLGQPHWGAAAGLVDSEIVNF